MPGPSIAIALFPGVEELEWAGPWEVLSGWALFGSVRRFHSEERARDVRRYIQYDPEPPV